MSAVVTEPVIQTADFGVAWNWEYDAEFVQRLDRACVAGGLRCYHVGPHNLLTTYLEVERGERGYAWFLDRASDEDARFLKLNQLLAARGTRFLNPHPHYQRAIDKAVIHSELAERGLTLPQTIILPPLEIQPEFDATLIESLVKPFVVKPARGGGGMGVLVNATLPDHVIGSRARLRQQRLLLQERIEPRILQGRRAWFRVYHACDTIIPCWWDDQTHRYAAFAGGDAVLVDTAELERIVRIVADVARLDFFSTEIALDRSGRYVVVDYVNDPCDMRLQSRCLDGVPDVIVEQIVRCLVHRILRSVEASAQPEIAGDDQTVADHQPAQESG